MCIVVVLVDTFSYAAADRAADTIRNGFKSATSAFLCHDYSLPVKSLGSRRNEVIFQSTVFFNEDNIKLIINTLSMVHVVNVTTMTSNIK